MTATRKNNPDSTPFLSDIEIYEEAQKLTSQGMDALLKQFFSELSDTTFEHLSPRETDRVIAQIKRKEDIILSSFLLQINNNFADFKVSRQFKFQQNPSANDQVLGLVGTNQYTELKEIESIVSRFKHKYSPFYVSIAEQLAQTIKRPNVDALDNPVHAKHLCLAFQSAISMLNLVIAQKVALYKVFANLVIEQIEPLYITLQECFISHQSTTQPNPMPNKKTTPEKELKSTETGNSAIMSRIPVLIGIFQGFKDKANSGECVFSSLLPSLKATLTQKNITEFDSLIDKLSVIFDIIFSDEDLPEPIKQQLARLQIFIFMSEIQHSGFAVRSSHPARRLIDTIVRTEVDFENNNQSNRSGYEFLRAEIDKIGHDPFLETDYYAQLCHSYIQHTSEGSTGSPSNKKDAGIESAAQVQPSESTSRPADVGQKKQDTENNVGANDSSTVDFVLEAGEPAQGSDKADNIYAVVHSMVHDIAMPLRMQGRSLILFDEVWFPLLLKVARKQGFKSQAWHKIVTIAKTQTWILTPKNNQIEFDKLKLTQPHIEKSVAQSMRSLAIPADQQTSLLDFLKHEMADVIKQSKEQIKQKTQARAASRQQEESSRKPEPQSKSRPAQDNLEDTIFEFSNLMETGRFKKSEDMLEALQFDNKAIAHKDNTSIDATKIHKGDWVEIKKGSTAVLAKLTWKDEKASQFIFVDREGHRVCDISREDLDSGLTDGSISLISSTPVKSQRAAFSIIQTLR